MFVAPTWSATSLVESPQAIGNARFVIVHAPVSVRLSQAIVFGVEAVETDERDASTFVGAVVKLPLGAAPVGANPVDASQPEDPAGVNVKALATYMGHSSITITLDRYGHLLPGNETEAAALLDTYLDRTDAKLTQIRSDRLHQVERGGLENR